jgi:hypothetical protein
MSEVVKKEVLKDLFLVECTEDEFDSVSDYDEMGYCSSELLGYENGFLVRKEFVEHYSNLLLKVREEDC